MLNKQGQTPLDILIEEEFNLLEITQDMESITPSKP